MTSVHVVSPFTTLAVGLRTLVLDEADLQPWEGSAPALAGTTLRVSRRGPDVVLLAMVDPTLPATDGLLSRWPDSGLVVLTTDIDGWTTVVEERPAAVLPPEIDPGRLVLAIHAVSAGFVLGEPERLALRSRHPVTASPAGSTGGVSPLTGRELEVLGLIAEGAPNKAIARDLAITEHTVKFHVGSILDKLDAGSRTEAVTKATRRGLLTI
ncbi:MAG: response regulator transcription factor [Chloroflexia bacterium]|nr:response regulator transcription factor [Chloroflexia bacterium]MDQ3513805.1 response regulator transcription factor [Chloroflexota bacterium]